MNDLMGQRGTHLDLLSICAIWGLEKGGVGGAEGLP